MSWFLFLFVSSVKAADLLSLTLKQLNVFPALTVKDAAVVRRKGRPSQFALDKSDSGIEMILFVKKCL